MIKTDSKVQEFKEFIKEGLYDICVLFYRCLYRGSCIPCQTASKVYVSGIRKLRVRGIHKLEKVRIAKRILFTLLLK